ncbi:AAA family ATPase [Patescibacteria group bacterium]|nr:MAG: AAA family ATPase [Patescibacteria group bacterium]
MEILICPTCGGIGSLKGAGCPTCGGDARLGIFGGLTLYWSKRLSLLGIAERRFEKLVGNIFLLLFLILGILGLAALIFEINLRPTIDIFSREFWLEPSVRLLFFYFTIWTDAYLISRIIREGERLRPVERKIYGQSKESAAKTWEAARAARGKRRLDISRSFSPAAMKAVEQAFELARGGNFAETGNALLLAALLETRDVAFLFGRLNIPSEELLSRLKRLLASSPPVKDVTVIADEFWQTLFTAYIIAFETRARYVRPLELFLAIAETPGPVQELLLDLGVDEKKVKNVTAWVRIMDELRERYHRGRARAAMRPRGAMNRAMTAIATPALDSLSDDLTERAVRGLLPPFVDREREMNSLFRILEGGRQSVLIVGQPGTGKQTFLEGLAERMAAEDVPAALQDKRLVSLSIPKLVAGATPAEAAERLEQIFYEVAVSGNIVLAVPAVEGLAGMSLSGGLDLAEIFESSLSKLRLLAIAATTPESYTELVERSAIGRSFEKLEFPEPETDGAIQICEAKAGGIEAQNRVIFSYDAVEKAVTLSGRYLHDRFLPEKAIEIMREVAHFVRGQRGEGSYVGGEDVAAIISEKSKIPVTAVTEKETEKLLRLEEELHQRVIGQDEAVSSVARAIRRARTELRAPNRPIANFLFLGPTGVGKTELAKSVAAVYFGREEAMVRLDMSEYQEPDSINRLIGAPGGRSGGVLTEAIRKQPFTLLLLDEIEKAHPDILNVFLQVMDDGRITDNVGRTVDCTNIILIATSNAGSQFIQDSIRGGLAVEAIKDSLINEKLKGIFRPEFINRFDGVIVFRPLAPEDVEKIARLLIIGIAKQLEAKQIVLEATEEAVSELAVAGFDPAFGARPLRRVLQERVQDALAKAMLEGKLGRRDTVILEKGGEIRIVKKA